MAAPLQQGDLFDTTVYIRPTSTAAEDIAAAAALVERVKATRPCVVCCERPYGFLTDARTPLPVSRLVRHGVSRARLLAALARSRAVCQRCLLAEVRPKMLRAAERAPVALGAKARTTSGGRAKPKKIEQAKDARNAPQKYRIG